MEVDLHITSYRSSDEEGFWGYQINDDVIQIQKVKHKEVDYALAHALLYGLEHINSWYGRKHSVQVYSNDEIIYDILEAEAPIIDVVFEEMNWCGNVKIGVVAEERYLDRACRNFAKQ